MDVTTINTLVGIIGGIIGVVGIVITVINIRSKKVITITQKEKEYVNAAYKGEFTFDYSNNNGEFIIGAEDYSFCTKWSKASKTSIHAYRDGKGIKAIALIKAIGDINVITEVEGDFSSRTRTPRIGDAIVWKNENDHYAITKVVGIKDDSRGDEKDELHCLFVILR